MSGKFALVAVALLVLAPASAAGDAVPDGAWRISTAGSYAGYRVRERLIFLSAPNDAVGRTSALVGTMRIENGSIMKVAVSADPRTLKSDKSNRDSAVRRHVWGACPRASFALLGPIPLAGLVQGKPFNFTAAARLTLRCTTRRVAFPLQARWDGDTFEVVGQLKLRLSDYGLEVPRYARLLSVSKFGALEVQLLWVRA